jgi:Mn-dependent DtxR family transcriptional regulator
MSSRARVTEADEERLERYLRSRAGDSDAYVKSKFIADDIGLTPSQVGLLLKRLRESEGDVDVEKWSYTNATTWRVTAAE